MLFRRKHNDIPWVPSPLAPRVLFYHEDKMRLVVLPFLREKVIEKNDIKDIIIKRSMYSQGAPYCVHIELKNGKQIETLIALTFFGLSKTRLILKEMRDWANLPEVEFTLHSFTI